MPKLSKCYTDHLLGCHSIDKGFYGTMSSLKNSHSTRTWNMLTGTLQHNQAFTIHEIYVHLQYMCLICSNAMTMSFFPPALPYRTGDFTPHNMLTLWWVYFSQQADKQHEDDCKCLCPQLGQMMEPHIKLHLSSYISILVARQGYMKRYPIKYN